MKTWRATEGAYETQRQSLLEYIILLVKAGVLVGSATGGEVGMEAPTREGAELKCTLAAFLRTQAVPSTVFDGRWQNRFQKKPSDAIRNYSKFFYPTKAPQDHLP
jgi:hypothetical protein